MKKESKKQDIPIENTAISLFAAVLLLIAIILELYIIYNVSNTNHLLSNFQRIDTIRDEQGICTNGFRLVDGVCYPTIGFDRKHHNKDGSQSDPNLCEHWKTVCHSPLMDGPVTCDVICEISTQ